jgi:hypothetical protein
MKRVPCTTVKTLRNLQLKALGTRRTFDSEVGLQTPDNVHRLRFMSRIHGFHGCRVILVVWVTHGQVSNAVSTGRVWRFFFTTSTYLVHVHVRKNFEVPIESKMTATSTLSMKSGPVSREVMNVCEFPVITFQYGEIQKKLRQLIANEMNRYCKANLDTCCPYERSAKR